MFPGLARVAPNNVSHAPDASELSQKSASITPVAAAQSPGSLSAVSASPPLYAYSASSSVPAVNGTSPVSVISGTSSSLFSQASLQSAFSDPSSVAAISSAPMQPPLSHQNSASSSIFHVSSPSMTASDLPSLDGSTNPSPTLPVSAVPLSVASPSTSEAPPAYGALKFDAVFTPNQPLALTPSNPSANLQQMFSVAPSPTASPAHISQTNPAHRSFSASPVSTTATERLVASPAEYVTPIQISPALELASPSHAPRGSQSATGKLVVKVALQSSEPLTAEEKLHLQEQLTQLVSSRTSANRRAIEAIISLVSNGDLTQEIELDLDKLDTATLRSIQSILEGDQATISKYSSGKSSAMDAKQKFLSQVEDKLRKDTFDMVSEMLKTMQDMAERVDELQTRVEALEAEKRESQQIQEKLANELKVLQDSRTQVSPSTLYQTSASPSRNPASPSQQAPVQYTKPTGSVFDLTQPPPSHSAPPKNSAPKPHSQPHSPMPAPSNQPPGVLPPQPQIVYMTPPGPTQFVPGAASPNVQYVYPMGMQPQMLPMTTTIQNPGAAAPTLTYVPQYYSVQRP